MLPSPRIINVGVSWWLLHTVSSWYSNIDSGEERNWYRPNTFDHDCRSLYHCIQEIRSYSSVPQTLATERKNRLVRLFIMMSAICELFVYCDTHSEEQLHNYELTNLVIRYNEMVRLGSVDFEDSESRFGIVGANQIKSLGNGENKQTSIKHEHCLASRPNQFDKYRFRFVENNPLRAADGVVPFRHLGERGCGYQALEAWLRSPRWRTGRRVPSSESIRKNRCLWPWYSAHPAGMATPSSFLHTLVTGLLAPRLSIMELRVNKFVSDFEYFVLQNRT